MLISCCMPTCHKFASRYEFLVSIAAILGHRDKQSELQIDSTPARRHSAPKNKHIVYRKKTNRKQITDNIIH